MTALPGPPHRLAIVASHVIQYQAPLYQALGRDPRFDLTVLFCSRAGAETYTDRELGVDVRWDTPLLAGYRHLFLRNLSPASPGRPWSAVAPGVVVHLLRQRYDAVVIPGYALASYWLACLGAWLSRTPVLFRGEAVLRPGRPAAVRLAKRLAVQFLLRRTAACLSIGSQSHAFYQAFGVPEERILFAPYTVDNAFFLRETDRCRAHRASLRRELGLAPDSVVVLFVGKLVPRKRPLDLIEALAGLDQRIQLVLVGDGPLRAEIERRKAAGARVTMAGFRNQSELPAYYAAADIFTLPSEHEVAPLVLNEAMCAGLPVVVSDAVPSARDMVEPGVNGVIHACGDVAGLAATLAALAGRPDQRAAFGDASRARIQRWSVESVVETLVAAMASFGRRPAFPPPGTGA